MTCRSNARVIKHLAVAAALAVTWLVGTAVPAAADGGCQYVLGFKLLHDLVPDVIGDCVDNQAFAANGDAQQHTTKGLMAWRKADNWTAFTNGYMTWVNGPNGVQSRLNTDRFSFESQVGKVLAADNFDDPNKTLLTRSSDTPTSASGYVDGEYKVQVKVPGAAAAFVVPATYSDTTTAVDVRIIGDTTGRSVWLWCRLGTKAGYGLSVHADTGQVSLYKLSADAPAQLAGPLDVAAFRPGNGSNHLELTCSGNSISASVNGAMAASTTDAAYTSGRTSIEAGTGQAPSVEARFDNLVVTQA